jgi:hypothetical protein
VIRLCGHIEAGKLTIDNRKRMAQELSNLKDGPVEIEIKRKSRRSNPQNRYYWGVVIAEIRLSLLELGNRFEPETVHEFLKGKFNPVSVVDIDGVVIAELPGSTTKMNKEQFGEYIDMIIEWAAEFLQIAIPLPTDKLTIDF